MQPTMPDPNATADAPRDLPPLPDDGALFLDFDGTLAELAPSPDAVVVAPGLIDTLRALQRRLDGALAVVSGRPLSQLDAFLAPLRLPLAGVHGAERRRGDGSVVNAPTLPPEVLDAAAATAEAFAAAHPGLLVERKPGALALHYRLAPELGPECLRVMQGIVTGHASLALLHGKCVVEAKPRDATKGHAIGDFMAERPFAGRRPFFAGDDVTDEAGFSMVQRLGGDGIKIGSGATTARFRVANPAGLRAWLSGGTP